MIEKNKKEYSNNYYKNNKNKWLKKINCEICNKQISRAGIYKHKKSLKHRLKILQNENDELKKS